MNFVAQHQKPTHKIQAGPLVIQVCHILMQVCNVAKLLILCLSLNRIAQDHPIMRCPDQDQGVGPDQGHGRKTNLHLYLRQECHNTIRKPDQVLCLGQDQVQDHIHNHNH